MENYVDIGIIPVYGLVPPKLPDLDSSIIESGLKNYRFLFHAVQKEASKRHITMRDDKQVDQK